MKNNMRKFPAAIVACMLAVSLTACQAPKEVAMTTYTAVDGTYSVTLPEGIVQSDVMGVIMMLDGTGNKPEIQAIAMGRSKSASENSGKEINSLEDYGDYMVSMMNISVEWSTTTEKEMESLDHCVLKEGTVKLDGVSSDAILILGESQRGYYGMVTLGKKKDLNNIKDKIAITSLAGVEKTTTVDFIDGMKAVLDSLNGGNSLNAIHAANQMYENQMLEGVDESAKKSYQTSYDQMQKSSQQGLSDSWDITDKATLLETKDDLMTSGHNQGALKVLTDYGVEETMSREDLEAKMVTDGLSEAETSYVLAAYDARAAFGDNAIRAWDLSRVPTIMGMGYGAGYCTYEEAMDVCLEAAKLAQQSFDSWDAFNQSYLYGYAYWSEESLDDPDSSAHTRQELVKALEAEENGPFTVDWNLELKKEW